MSELHFIFASSHYSGSALSFATALAAIAILSLGIGALTRGRGMAVTALFFLVSAAASGWLASFAAMYASRDAATALPWARLGYCFGALIPAAVFHLAARLVARKKEYRAAVALFWIGCATAGLLGLLTDFLIPNVRHYAWGFYPAGRPRGGIIVLFFSAIIIAAIQLFWRTYRNAEGKARERAGALLLAFALGSMAMADYLPSVGIDLQPIGFVAALAFVIVAATALWRFELSGITPEYAAGQILETMKNSVLVSDMDGRIRVVNRAAERLLGYKPEQLRDAHLRQILQGDENLTTGQLINSLGVLEHPMVWRAADGARVDVLAASSFLRDHHGTPVGVVYVASDFTERKRAEQALRESEHRYRTLFEMNPLPMWVYDFDTLAFIAVNDAAVRHYGYSRDEFLKMKISDIRPPAEIPAMLDALRQIEERRGPRQFHHRRKDGTIIDVDVTSFEFVSGGRRARMVIAQDITERKRAEEELRLSEERHRTLFENAHDLVYTHDLQGRLTSINPAGERITGYTRAELLGRSIQDLVVPEHLQHGLAQTQKKLAGEAESTFYELDIHAKDGRRVSLELSSRLIYRDGKPVGVQGIARDVTERKASEARYRLLFERNLAGVYRTGADGRILDCNEACARIFGYESRDEFLTADASDFYFDDAERDRVVQMLRDQKQLSNLELRLRRRDGSAMWVLENVALLENDVLEGTIIDVTDRKHAHELMEYQAYHDALTGLPNRLLFRDRISVALAHAKRNGRSSAVMFLDLDQFKLVNDTLGHTVGDRLLQVIGARVATCVRAEDTVARMGGDEFTVLLADLSDRKGATAAAQKVLEAIRHPVVIDEHELFVTTSIGMAIFPDDGEDAEALLKNADRAMYRAKELGRDNYQFSTPARFERAEGRLSLERSLHHAIERREFVLHYQPMVEIATGRVVGAEALVRWNHPVNGLIQPEDFIPIAEDTNLILPLGEWVLRTACSQMKAWHDAGHAWLRVAVNLSPRQFQDRELAHMVERTLADTGFPAPFLDLEITESTAMQNAELSLSILKRLKEMGIRISIDDFGTGHSSLSYLKRFPIDTVKIDQGFVRDLTTDDAAIISAVISMARALNLRVIAEGVETEEQLAFLRREQCAEMQGFLYSQPLAAAEFEQALRTGMPTPMSNWPMNRLRLTLE
ncbi:MAG TPA: PAS domain S-box protein [Thermoanaerobaculia bacterium]|nr:PAS domain S-box protein [Thermoanaerobaculia bacterium]